MACVFRLIVIFVKWVHEIAGFVAAFEVANSKSLFTRESLVNAMAEESEWLIKLCNNLVKESSDLPSESILCIKKTVQ